MRVWVVGRSGRLVLGVMTGLAAALLIVRSLHGGPIPERIDETRIHQAERLSGAPAPVYRADGLPPGDRRIALTFDISWGERVPTRVLDVLDAYGVPATFFLSGPWARRHPEVVRRIAAGGREVQSHGQRHDNFSQLSAQQVAENIMAAHAILTELTGREPSLIRPPNGDFDRESLLAAERLGYRTVIWSVDSHDWMNPGVDTITSRVLRLVHPGAIVLMHASDSARDIDRALPAILEGLLNQGWELVRLSDLLGPASAPPTDPDRALGRR